MLFYVASLLTGLIGTGVLYWAFSRSLECNASRRNRRPISYLAPVFLSLLMVLFAIGFAAPRLQDLVSLASGNLQVQEIELGPQQIGLLTIEIDSKNYCYNRLEVKPLPATPYRMTALPYSRHVLRLEPIAEITTAGGQK